MAENAEYVWVKENVPKEPCKIMVLGSRNDPTIDVLTENGYYVVGVDLHSDPRKMDNYEFHQCDFMNTHFDEKFDCVYAISVIEHIGLSCYDQNIDETGDYKAVKKLFDLLKSGGVMLITVPYGCFTEGHDWRVYDKNRLKTLVGNYDHSTTFFLATTEIFLTGWRFFNDLSPSDDVVTIVHDGSPIIQINYAENVCSVACIKIVKPKEN